MQPIDTASLTVAVAYVLVFVVVVVPIVGSAIMWLICFGIPMAAIEFWFSVVLPFFGKVGGLRCRMNLRDVRCAVHMTRLMVLIAVVLSFAAAGCSQKPVPDAQGVTDTQSAVQDPFAGTWKLNVAASRYKPGPAPKSSVTTYEFTSVGMLVSNTTIDAQGKESGFKRIEVFDGKPHPLGENPDNAISVQRLGPNRVMVATLEKGDVIATLEREVSTDGRTMTAVARGFNEKGRFTEVRIFEKQ